MNRTDPERPQATRRKLRLIVAEDDSDLRGLIAYALRLAGYEVLECAHGLDLAGRLDVLLTDAEHADLAGIITDVRMPGVTGLSVLDELRAVGSAIPVFVITAFGSAETHARAAALGAVRTFDKPFDLDELVGEVVRTIGL